MQPILFDFPEAFNTERLTIRSPRPGDGPKLFEATVETLNELRQFPASLPWAMESPSIENSEAFCRNGYANFAARRDFPLLMLLRGTDTIVGSGGLHNPRWSIPAFEIGWWGRTPYLGRGLITEGIEAMLGFAFSSLKARRVEAFSDDLNQASCRLCERVGMKLEGVLRNARVDPDGTLRTTRVYSKIS